MIEQWMERLGDVLGGQVAAGSVWAFATVFAGGVLVSFTPCVYPVIPLIVGFIGNQAKGSRKRAFFLSLSYVLGMALVYTALGALASLTGMMFGSLQSSPWLFFVVGNVVLVAAATMLGFIHIPVPSFLGRHAVGREGIAGAFVMGAFSSTVTAPCSAPVLLVILGIVATGGNVLFGTLLLLSYSLGMGVLLLLVGTFVGLLTSLPKGGKWMLWIERAFGVIMLLIAEYFLVKAGSLAGPGGLF